MKHSISNIILLSAILFVPFTIMAEEENSTYRAYIEQYKDIAIQGQQEYKIPASISMAQGLLESGAGQSELAKNANNHFGIKCAGNWTGETYAHDDDKKNDCFRKYDNAEESWVDHAQFLQRERYQVLFSYDINDYQSWAKGLSTCGYATDKKYPDKLIHLIETYHLDHLVADAPAQHIEVEKQDTVFALDTLETEEKVSLEEHIAMEATEIFHDHRSGRCNGVRYIIVEEGESFQTLAYYLNIKEKTLRKYNDATDGRELNKGDRVYIYPKKKKADSKHSTYMVRSGDTAWSIAQRFGIQMKSIYIINGIKEGIPLVTKQELDLR